MPTSSIIKPIVINKDAAKKFVNISRTMTSKDLKEVKTDRYEKGNQLATRFVFQ